MQKTKILSKTGGHVISGKKTQTRSAIYRLKVTLISKTDRSSLA